MALKLRTDISRREFIGAGAAGLAAEPLGLIASTSAAAGIPIALQLYSVRHDCAEDLPRTVAAVARMGYKGVEFVEYEVEGMPALDSVKRCLENLRKMGK